MRLPPAAVARALDAAGGLTPENGAVRDPAQLWASLESAQRILVYAEDRRTVVGEIRILADGAAVYRDGEAFTLLSPEELEGIARARPLGL